MVWWWHNGTQAHFSTPMSLGYSPGYKPGLVEIGKAGTWWQTWNSDRDVFEDVKDKLKSGLVYCTSNSSL